MTVAFLLRQGIEIKVLSGDSPQTVAAIARDVGIPVGGVAEGSAIPDEPVSRQRFAVDATVVGRISPEGKQAIVQALRDQGHYVAMVGDGVNDVPALKSSRLAIAQGSGTQMARSVSDLVLIMGASEPAGADHDRLGVELLRDFTDRLPRLPARHPRGRVEPTGPRELRAVLRLVARDVRDDLVEIDLLRDKPPQRR